MNAKEFLEYILTNVVDNKEAVAVEVQEDELGTLLTVRVDKADMGIIIGKWGNTINSIRSLMRLYGSKENKRINVKVLD